MPGPSLCFFQICCLHTVNELFKRQVKRACFREGVFFFLSRLCMYANVYVWQHRGSDLLLLLSLVTVCLYGNRCQALGWHMAEWQGYQTANAVSLCVCVHVCDKPHGRGLSGI